MPGSSPLARGLRDLPLTTGAVLRIIPARAGFTVTGHHRYVCVRDHPRSRGVYYRRSLTAWGITGSSPLARGLPVICLTASCFAGIIPARAGFTEV